MKKKKKYKKIIAVIIAIIIAIVYLLFPFSVKSNDCEKSNVLKEEITEVSTEENVYEIIANEYIERIGQLENIKDENIEQWFIEYKEFIEKNKNLIGDTPLTIYECFSKDELDLLFRVVQAEVGDEYFFFQKCNVANVIFNRLVNANFENTLTELLNENQFSTISNERYLNVEVSETTILACEFAFEIKDTTYGSLFFDSNNALSKNYEFVFNDGAHNFYKLKE